MKPNNMLSSFILGLLCSLTYQGGPNLSNTYKENKKKKHISVIINLTLDWPKATTEPTDDFDYSKILIKKYDKGGKDSLNFVEFCKMMEDLWGAADVIAEQKCNSAIAKANEIFERLFRWLDRDQDGLISAHDMIYGISRIMIRDANIDEVNNIFVKYDVKKTGKINRKIWLNAMSNGMLKKSLKNDLNTETLEK